MSKRRGKVYDIVEFALDVTISALIAFVGISFVITIVGLLMGNLL